jgi:hypothetical protein
MEKVPVADDQKIQDPKEKQLVVLGYLCPHSTLWINNFFYGLTD